MLSEHLGTIAPVLVPVLVFLACFGVGVVASARWLPDLAPGQIGGLAFFTVTGLLAAALSLGGLHVYTTIREITTPPANIGVDKAEILAGGLLNILRDTGTLAALAGIIYLLGPPGEDELADEPKPADQPAHEPPPAAAT